MKRIASTFSISPSEAPPETPAVEIAETPWALIGGIIAAVVVIGIVAAIFRKRQK